MSLRTKLFAAFAGLAAIALLVIAVALVTTWRWQAANAEVETHFRRSLLLESVRANTFQALKEVDDALTGDHVDARGDFERALVPATRDFTSWADYADTPEERAEVARVRAAHERLVASGRRVFDLAGTNREAAIRLADDEVDTKDFAAFQRVTDQAVAADRVIRRDISAQTARVRETAQVMLAISAISVLSLMLLIAAYLSSDLFRPLRDLAGVLDRLSRGDRSARADDARGDEIGAVARGINALADAGQAPEQADTPLLPPRARTLALSPVDLTNLLQAALARHRGELDRRGIAIELYLSPVAPIMGDATKLAVALDEAIRHALAALPDSGGRLGLRSYADGGLAHIEIAENGPGLDPAAVEKGFGDTGNGLSTACASAQAHGGTLTLFSEPGRGSVTQFSLPLA